MNISGDTILITGGGSGIGRGLAEAFHARGARVIVAGRRKALLDEVTRANPGMASAVLDITDPEAVKAFAAQVVRDHPGLNVLVNNAGVARTEDVAKAPAGLDDAETMVATNVLGPIRLTQALLPHLRAQPRASVVNVSSGLAFVPMRVFATYCATKAFLHSWSVSLRAGLKADGVEVVEIIPPYVQTELGGPRQASDPHAMPLADFIRETMEHLSQDGREESVVENARPLREAPGQGKVEAMAAMLDQMEF